MDLAPANPRVSSYLIAAPLRGDRAHVLMHGYSGAVDKVSADLGAYLLEHRGDDCSLHSGPLAALAAEERDTLFARGYLTALTAEEERQAMVRIAATLHDSDLQVNRPAFMLVPTYTCNLRCPYCFQAHTMHAGRGDFATVMSREQVDNAFAVMDAFDRPGAIASALGLTEDGNGGADAAAASHGGTVSLFGGEPLWEPSRDVVPYIVAQSVARGKALYAVTNGVQLHLFADVLGPGLIEELQITLDGLAALHDSRRVGPKFRKTFDAITSNVDLALERGARVALRLNVDKTNVAEVQPLDEFFTNRGWNAHPNFMSYASAVHPEGRHKELVSPAELVELTMGFDGAEGEHVESYENMARDTLQSCLGEGYPFRNVAHCSAESGLLIFDPLGDVYSCWEEVGEIEHRVATYTAGGIEFDARAAGQWLARFPGAIDQCSRCPYALIHTSGCASRARKANGTIFSSACESFQQYFPTTLAAAYEDFEQSLLEQAAVTGVALPMAG